MAEEKNIQIALMGYGVVGSGVAEVFYQNHANIEERAGVKMDMRYILELRDVDIPYPPQVIKDFNIILQDPEVRIVVETIGGLRPAYAFVKDCLLAGKSVVTSNKELVADRGAELLQIARDHNANFLFEASVGGGIPILRPLNSCLSANNIVEICGILNGTSNYILTKMIREGTPFDAALKGAQDLGYAERDPSADIDGLDTCRKICILASLAYGRHVYPDQVHTEGIRGLSLRDVTCAAAAGCVIKLIGRVKKQEDGKLQCATYPALIRRDSQLSTVDDVFNGILVRGDAIGDVVFYGRGAGKLPTASAVVADVIDCAKHLSQRKLLFWEDGGPDTVADYLDDRLALFVRGSAENHAAAAREAEAAFGPVEWIRSDGAEDDEIAFITPVDVERTLRDKIKALRETRPLSTIRVANV